LVSALGVDPRCGLGRGQVVARLARHGRNRLREVQPRSPWRVLVAQFESFLVLLLAVASVVAFAFGEWVEGGAILAVLVINTLLGFFTELGAIRSMEALRKLGVASATVRREGKVGAVPAAELVPGDIVLVEGGDVVTADLRVLEASKLQANESTLTGESLPVAKSADPVPEAAALAERSCMLFKGTVVTRGSGMGLVVATGMSSELGRISRLTQAAKEETTPLERRLNQLGQGLVWVTLVLALFVIASGLATHKPLLLIIETAIALAVAAVPEGLPIIATIALARGMRRMARHNALVNRLSAVETLGATSVLCTDKTGTLTVNELSVGRLCLAEIADARRRALEVGVLCNNASLDGRSHGRNHGQDHGVGDPLEVALLIAAADEGISRARLLADAPERREVAFDSELKMMATVHGAVPPYRVAVKGAPESVLAACTLDEAERERWLANSEELAAAGLRVLAVAEGRVDDLGAEVYAGLTFVGLVGLLDPPRTAVRETIAAFRRAGVRVVMVTGDHPITATNIARATGLVDEEEPTVILGSALEHAGSLPAAEQRRLLGASIFARVSPKQKLELVALHQAAGTIVAMTGDGVNDAPALRKADIGVAMGGRGTGAAREAAAMVLKDDELSTIVVAIREGRAIFENIRKFVMYLLSCNMSEVLVVALAVLVGAPVPLLPLQILFLNLVTDVFPALALGVGEAGEEVMRRPPRDAKEPVLTRAHWREIVWHGLVITACVLGAFAIALRPMALGATAAVSVAFSTLAFAQLWHVFNMRRAGAGLVRNEITRNPWVWGALALCVAIVLVGIYLPPLARVLSLESPGVLGWLVVAGMSVAPAVIGLGVDALREARRQK
jgi:Ca2+-transporting ATPase